MRAVTTFGQRLLLLVQAQVRHGGLTAVVVSDSSRVAAVAVAVVAGIAAAGTAAARCNPPTTSPLLEALVLLQLQQ